MLSDFEWPSPPRGMVWGRKPYLEYSKTVLVRPLYQSGQDGSQAIPCATLNVTVVLGEYRLYVESLKYYDKERGCLVSGRKILAMRSPDTPTLRFPGLLVSQLRLSPLLPPERFLEPDFVSSSRKRDLAGKPAGVHPSSKPPPPGLKEYHPS